MQKIDYNAMFGEGGNDFEGDPFGELILIQIKKK